MISDDGDDLSVGSLVSPEGDNSVSCLGSMSRMSGVPCPQSSSAKSALLVSPSRMFTDLPIGGYWQHWPSIGHLAHVTSGWNRQIVSRRKTPDKLDSCQLSILSAATVNFNVCRLEMWKLNDIKVSVSYSRGFKVHLVWFRWRTARSITILESHATSAAHAQSLIPFLNNEKQKQRLTSK